VEVWKDDKLPLYQRGLLQQLANEFLDVLALSSCTVEHEAAIM
jgi:hypothetical protein